MASIVVISKIVSQEVCAVGSAAVILGESLPNPPRCGEGAGLFLFPPVSGELSRSFSEEVILGTFANRFLPHRALRQRQVQRELLA